MDGNLDTRRGLRKTRKIRYSGYVTDLIISLLLRVFSCLQESCPSRTLEQEVPLCESDPPSGTRRDPFPLRCKGDLRGSRGTSELIVLSFESSQILFSEVTVVEVLKEESFTRLKVLLPPRTGCRRVISLTRTPENQERINFYWSPIRIGVDLQGRDPEVVDDLPGGVQ